MRLVRGRASDPETDRRRSRETVDRVADTGEPALRVWTPHRQVVFGRRDARSDGYDRARTAARERGYDVVEREVGGRAVAYTGIAVAFSLAEPVDDDRTGIRSRYDETLDAVRSGLADCGVETRRGEPPNSFCPGSHSLRVDGGKVVGVAQRVRRTVAVVAGVVVVRDHEAVAGVLAPVYDALGVPFDPTSVGSLADAGTVDPETVVEAIETALAAGRETHAASVRET